MQFRSATRAFPVLVGVLFGGYLVSSCSGGSNDASVIDSGGGGGEQAGTAGQTSGGAAGTSGAGGALGGTQNGGSSTAGQQSGGTGASAGASGAGGSGGGDTGAAAAAGEAGQRGNGGAAGAAGAADVQGGAGGDSGLAGEGGQAGTGGVNDVGGQGGVAGSDGDAGSGGTSGPMIDGEIIFQEDFESATPDTVPDQWQSFIGYQIGFSGNTPGASQFALVDASKAHGGTQALHVKDASGNGPVHLTRVVGGFETLYVRAYVFSSVPLGQQTEAGHNHLTLVALRHAPGASNDEIRFGEVKGTLGTNESSTDDLAPGNVDGVYPMGERIPANEWVCLELAFLADRPYHELHVSANGELVHSITSAEDWSHGSLPDDWITDSDPSDDELVFGWEAFSAPQNEVWFDDIIVATGPIGCD